ncbi:MAPEG family protein [Thalassotalea ganghwensis]
MIYAMAAMVLLTTLVGIVTVKARFASVKRKQVSVKYFQLMEGQEVPELVAKSTRSFNNQFELPVLFYVVCTLFVSLGIESQFALIVSWVFVASRYLHAYIHLTYNNVLHRLWSFWVGFACTLILWVALLVNIT